MAETLAITGINPASVTKGQSVAFTLTGNGFQSGFAAKLINELGVEFNPSSTQFVNSSTVRVTVFLGSGPTSTQTIRITNPDGQNAQINFQAIGKFYLTISPLSALPGTIFTVNGIGFTPTSTVTSHLKKPDGTEFSTLQIPTDGQEYTWPIDSTEFVPGAYQHWVFDDTTGTRSNTVGFSVEAAQINESDLVKGSGPEVYYIQNDIKRHIPDPETFNILQFDWATIKPVSDSLLVSIDEGDPIPPLRNSMLIKRDQEIHVYIIESGQKRWLLDGIPDESTLDLYGLRFDEVIPVEAVFFDLIILGVPIPSSTTPPPMTPSAASANFGLDSTSGYAADPVNTALGNFTYQHTDLNMPGRGLFFEFTRTYNSADTYSGPLGTGWTHSYNIAVTEKMVNEAEDQAFVKWGDGHEDFYTYSSGSYVSEFGHDILIKDGELLELTTREQIRYRFVPAYYVEFFDDSYNVITSVSWRLLDIQDRNGNRILLSYDYEGKLIGITDTVGRVVRLSYDGDGKRIDNIFDNIIDPLGRTVELFYTGDDLTKVKDLGGRYTSLAYDERHHLTSITDARGNSLVTNEYDDNGKVKTQIDAKGYRTTYEYYEADRRTIVTDSLGNNTTYLHDERNRLVQIIDALSTTNKYAYDQKNNRTSVTDKRENITEYTYDSSGNVLTKTDALTNVTSITYDSNNNPITREDALGNVTAFEYDANGNLIKTTNALDYFTTTIYNTHGQPLSVTGYNGNTTNYNYDAEGNLVGVTDPLDNTIIYTYDDVGRRRTKTEALDRITKYSYDNNDNLLSVTDPLGNIVSSTFDENGNNRTNTDAMGNTTSYTYDVKDLVESITDPLNNSAEYTYDGLDRKISATDKNGNATTYAYDEKGNLLSSTDALNNSTSYTYDSNGNILSETDPLGLRTTYTYDAMNRVTSTIDPLGNTTTNTYDELGRVTTTTNAKNQTTGFEHDVLGRLVKVTDAEEGVITYIYDKNGNRLSMTDPNGNTTSYTYDAVNRLIRKTEAMESTYRYAYDAQGNMTSHIDANDNTVSYTYDANDRLFKITYPDASIVRFAYNANGNRTSMVDSLGETFYTYDSLNKLTSYADPFGKSVGYSYDPNGNKTSITYPGGKAVNYSYDPLNRLIWVTDWLSNKTNYAYNAAGRLTNILNPNNTTATYTYDAADRLKQLLNAKSDQTVISSYAYTLDALGNHIQVVKDEPLAIALADSNIAYTYDAENRLTDAGGTIHTYNANGNLTARDSDAFGYDFNNRLMQSNINGTITQYNYDGLGNRLSKTGDSTATRYVLDVNGSLSNILAETDNTGTITAYYVYGLGLISKILPNGIAWYYHYDSRGSTVAMTDAEENITDTYAYEPFGTLSNSAGSTKNPFKYVGRYGVVDDGNGLNYIRARYYAPEVGRFITKDTFTGKESDGQSLNRYVYALNNPVMLIDISGFYSINNIFLDTKELLEESGKAIIKDSVGNILKGTSWALKEGYRTSYEVIGGVQGTIKSNMGGWNIKESFKKGLSSFIITKALDTIDPDAEVVPYSWIFSPLIQHIFFRCNYAGGDLDCAGRDAEYCESLKKEMDNNKPLIPEIGEIQSYKYKTYKK